MFCVSLISSFFFFNDTATTEIYTLSLHDALPISEEEAAVRGIRREVDEPTDVLVTEVVNLGVHAPVVRPDREVAPAQAHARGAHGVAEHPADPLLGEGVAQCHLAQLHERPVLHVHPGIIPLAPCVVAVR